MTPFKYRKIMMRPTVIRFRNHAIIICSIQEMILTLKYGLLKAVFELL